MFGITVFQFGQESPNAVSEALIIALGAKGQVGVDSRVEIVRRLHQALQALRGRSLVRGHRGIKLHTEKPDISELERVVYGIVTDQAAHLTIDIQMLSEIAPKPLGARPMAEGLDADDAPLKKADMDRLGQTLMVFEGKVTLIALSVVNSRQFVAPHFVETYALRSAGVTDLGARDLFAVTVLSFEIGVFPGQRFNCLADRGSANRLTGIAVVDPEEEDFALGIAVDHEAAG